MIPANAIHVVPSTAPLRASIILLHGYMASAAGHREDGLAFSDDGVEVVMPDAPGHGARDDGRLARIGALPESERHAAILEISREWLAEVRWLAGWCRERGAQRVGLVGISMGGFAALALLPQPCAFDAIAAVLAAPTLVDERDVTPGRPPLLIGLAGRDEAVPPAPGRAFAARYGAELHEYPESQHIMRGEDWFDLWRHTAAFFDRHLNEGSR